MQLDTHGLSQKNKQLKAKNSSLATNLKPGAVRGHFWDLLVQPIDEVFVAAFQKSVGLVQDEEPALLQRHLAGRNQVLETTCR